VTLSRCAYTQENPLSTQNKNVTLFVQNKNVTFSAKKIVISQSLAGAFKQRSCVMPAILFRLSRKKNCFFEDGEKGREDSDQPPPRGWDGLMRAALFELSFKNCMLSSCDV
jgi:hypothetical protein